MARKTLICAALVAGLAAGGTGAQASDWAVRPAESSIAFSVSGNFFGESTAVEGSFPSFTAEIAFDPDAPETGHAVVEIDASKLEPNYEDVGRQAPKPKYFDTAAHKTIRFESISLEAAGSDGAYFATGRLTLKGVTKEVSFPFRVGVEDKVATMDGSLVLDRLDFAIGDKPDRKSSAWLETPVRVTLHLVADRK